MTYKIIFSQQANLDLREISEYISLTLSSPNTATNLLNKLEKAILSLKIFPERYRVYQTEPLKSKKIRLFPVANYIILYTTDIPSKIVNIIRVIYGKRNVANHLLLHEKRQSYRPIL